VFVAQAFAADTIEELDRRVGDERRGPMNQPTLAAIATPEVIHRWLRGLCVRFSIF